MAAPKGKMSNLRKLPIGFGIFNQKVKLSELLTCTVLLIPPVQLTRNFWFIRLDTRLDLYIRALVRLRESLPDTK